MNARIFGTGIPVLKLLLLVALLASCSAGPLYTSATNPPALTGSGLHAPPLIPTGTGALFTAPDTGPAQPPPGFGGAYTTTDENAARTVSSYSSGSSVTGSVFSAATAASVPLTSASKPSTVGTVFITAGAGAGFATLLGGIGANNLRTYQIRGMTGGFIGMYFDANQNPIVLGTSQNTYSNCVETVNVTEEATIDTGGNVEYLVNASTNYQAASGFASNTCSVLFGATTSANISSGTLGVYWQLANLTGGLDLTRASQVLAIGVSYFYALTQ